MLRPLSKRQLEELRGYISAGPAVFRAALFILVVAASGAVARTVSDLLFEDGIPPVWLLVPALVAISLYRVSGRWTGGYDFRQAVRRDLAGGVLAATRIDVMDAILIEEREDEGPTFFLLTSVGTTMVFAGQYLVRPAAKGFPWRSFEIHEAPASRVFFGLNSLGEPFPPSETFAAALPSHADAAKLVDQKYATIDVLFESLRSDRSSGG